jgi:hypothetical protein
VDPVPDPMLLGKSGSAGNLTQDFWVSSQELKAFEELFHFLYGHTKNETDF